MLKFCKAMVSEYLTNYIWKQKPHGSQKTLYAIKHDVIDTQCSQKWQISHEGGARPRHCAGKVQLTLAPVPAFCGTFSTANDLDSDANDKLTTRGVWRQPLPV